MLNLTFKKEKNNTTCTPLTERVAEYLPGGEGACTRGFGARAVTDTAPSGPVAARSSSAFCVVAACRCHYQKTKY